LPVALASIATLAFTWRIARRGLASLGVAPALATWALATMALPFAIGRSVATDPFLAAAIAGFWALAPSPAAIALLGLGFFIKGPVVFVATVLPVCVLAVWERSREPLRRLGPGWSWALFAAIGLPWFAIAVAG